MLCFFIYCADVLEAHPSGEDEKDSSTPGNATGTCICIQMKVMSLS